MIRLFRHVREDVKNILARDPAARSFISVMLLYPGLHAIWAHRVSHWLWRHNVTFLARWISQAVRSITLIEIHPGAKIGRGCFIDHGNGVVIGETAVVGRDVTIYQGVTLGGTSLERTKRHPTVEDRVLVGAGAKVLGDIVIGHDTRIGANSVVTKSVRPHSVVVGVPGQVIAVRGEVDIKAKGSGGDTPDPVGQAVHQLMARVNELEQKVHGHSHAPVVDDTQGYWEYEDFTI